MLFHDRQRRPLVRLAMAAAAIGLFVIGYYWGNQYKQNDSAPPLIEGVLVRPPTEIPGFEVRDAVDQPFTAESFRGHWTLLSFGDPSQAPGHLAVMRMIEVHNRLAGDPGLQIMLQLTLAAERQDPNLAQDFGRLSPALVLLSGEPGELQKLRASVGAPAEEATDPEAVPFYLIGPDKRLLALFTGTQAPASIASDLAAISAHADALDPDHD